MRKTEDLNLVHNNAYPGLANQLLDLQPIFHVSLYSRFHKNVKGVILGVFERKVFVLENM